MDYWTSFWQEHARASVEKDPQVQVLRTLDKKPIAGEAFAAIIGTIKSHLAPQPGQSLLDLCCGNGVITRCLYDQFASITAVDLAQEFIDALKATAPAHVRGLVADAKGIDFPEASFDRILFYGAQQYFSEAESVDLWRRFRAWLKPGGRVLVGDIPDASRRWNFFDSPSREDAYFKALQASQPIVGHWFETEWMTKLAAHAGFSRALVCPQPATLPYSHYRIDLLLQA